MKKLQTVVLMTVTILLTSIICFVQSCGAVTLKTKREAFNEIFSREAKMVEEVKPINASQREQIKSFLGGYMHIVLRDKGTQDIEEEYNITFYAAEQDGQKLGAAIILTEPGKWGPIQLMIGLTNEANIIKIVVMRYTEVRGRPIARRSFLSQFAGKGIKDEFKLGKDIIAVSGATISSQAASFTAKKALIIFKTLYQETNNE